MMARNRCFIYRRSGSWKRIFFWKVGWKVLYIIFIADFLALYLSSRFEYFILYFGGVLRVW